jgi:hypothetical protein
MLESIHHTRGLELVPGQVYTFSQETLIDRKDPDKLRKGVFVEYVFDTLYRQWAIFNMIWSENRSGAPTLTLYTEYMKIWHDIPSMIAKQSARGLSQWIPEDCSGIIERMLVGDVIVGKGPDRYPERLLV